MVAKNEEICKQRISGYEITREKLTSRGGITLFVRYLESTGVYGLLLECFAAHKKTRNGNSGRYFKDYLYGD